MTISSKYNQYMADRQTDGHMLSMKKKIIIYMKIQIISKIDNFIIKPPKHNSIKILVTYGW